MEKRRFSVMICKDEDPKNVCIMGEGTVLAGRIRWDTVLHNLGTEDPIKQETFYLSKNVKMEQVVQETLERIF
jgi:hypothetical protein